MKEYGVKNNNYITLSEIECSFSHIKAIQTAYNNNNEYALIIEDDCSFEFLKYKNIPIKKLFDYDENKNLIQLCSNIKEIDTSSKILANKNFCQTTCYVISNKYMKIILDTYIDNFHIADEIWFIYREKITNCTSEHYFTYFDVKSYIRKNTCLFQNIKNKWTKYYKDKKDYSLEYKPTQ